MIPEDHKQDVITTGMEFVRAINNAYGSTDAMELWDNIFAVLDPDIKGEVLMNMLTGEYQSQKIRIAQSLFHSNNFVPAIKAVREVTGLGLKEAKDLCDSLRSSSAVIEISNKSKRSEAIGILRNAGLTV